MILRLILAATIIVMPNIARFHVDTGVPGLNVSNMVLLVVVVALALARGGNQSIRPTGQLTPALAGFFVVLLIGFAIASVYPPAQFMTDFLFLKDAIFYPLFYFVFRRCRQDLKGTRQLIILVMVVAAVAGVQAIRQGLDYGIGQYNESRRAAGPFGDNYLMANIAGVYYAMFLPMFLALALFLRGQRFWRLAAIVGSVILAFAIMVTYSRQSYFIAIACLALLLVRRSAILAVVLGIAMIGAVELLPESVTQRVTETQQEDGVGEAKLDVSTASRFEIWDGGIRMWRDHPMGVGLGRFSENIGDYAPHYRNYDAHNFYIRTLAESGPLGVLALLWVLLSLVRLSISVQRSAVHGDAEARALGRGFSVCVLALAMGNLYGSRFFDGALMASFWMLCGLMERYAALQGPDSKTVRAPMQQPQVMAPASIGDRFPLADRVFPGRNARRVDAP